jgi:hypothetical protein
VEFLDGMSYDTPLLAGAVRRLGGNMHPGSRTLFNCYGKDNCRTWVTVRLTNGDKILIVVTENSEKKKSNVVSLVCTKLDDSQYMRAVDLFKKICTDYSADQIDKDKAKELKVKAAAAGAAAPVAEAEAGMGASSSGTTDWLMSAAAKAKAKAKAAKATKAKAT